MDICKTFDELAEKWVKAAQEVPGITAGFNIVQMRFQRVDDWRTTGCSMQNIW